MPSVARKAIEAFAERHGPHKIFSAPTALHAKAWSKGKPDPQYAVPTTMTGPTEAPGYTKALVIAHGLMGTTNNFYTPGTQLSRDLDGTIDGVVAVDMRNHGRSPHKDVHSSVALATDLLLHIGRMADAAPVTEDPPRYVLMGHSMGGTAVCKAAMVASDPHAREKVLAECAPEDVKERKMLEHAAVNFDELIAGVIVVDVCPSQRMPGAFNRISNDLQALMDVELTVDSSPKSVGERLRSKITDDMMRNFLLTNLISGRPKDGEPASWRCNLPVLRHSLDHLAFPITEEVEAEHKVKAPTLFVFGDRSPYNHAEGRRAIDKFFANAEQVEIEKSGHYPHFEQKDAFCDVVAPFIRRCLDG
uniref:AB hydrolase-1 domain-containing protein n=1 Tax=Neobodo designis TaxID=312471 RepID=A0A7S1Q7G6_NEODS|mmetsp:Transcript_33234/g.102608  ORF Transcript_33234/g.102608 Transcript_33234/m.102608 type:complete len:361 (+) Transcript_33234:92-1174(+)